MKVSFDGDNKLILINNGETELDAKIDVYSDWKEWIIEDKDNSKWLQALRTVGGDQIGGSQTISPYFFLLNGWRLKPYEGDHRLVVSGNLFVEGGGNPFCPCLGSYNVLVELQTSPQSITDTITVSAGSGLDQSEHDQLFGLPTDDEITTSVWNADLSSHDLSASSGRAIVHDVYGGVVCIDTINGKTGTAFPRGLSDFPVNNLADAKTIAGGHNIREFKLYNNLVVPSGVNINDYIFQAEQDIDVVMIMQPGCTTKNTRFHHLILMGTFDGKSYIEHSTTLEIHNFSGFMIDTILMDNIGVVDPSVPSLFNMCGGGKVSPPIEIDLNNSSLTIGGWKAEMKLINKNGTTTNIIELMSGQVSVDSTCVSGSIILKGVGRLVSDDSGPNCTVDTTDLVNRYVTAEQVWDEHTSGYVEDGTFGAGFQVLQSDLKRACGLLHENIYIDNPVYDDDNNLTSARVRIYSDNLSVGSNQNVLSKYTLNATPAGAGKFSTWSQITSG